MNSREIKGRLENRSPIFTFDSSAFVSQSDLSVSAIVWAGVGGSGNLNKLLPIVFDHHEEYAENLSGFADKTGEQQELNSPVFHSTPNHSVIDLELTYNIQVISIDNLEHSSDTDEITTENIITLAENWEGTHSEESVRYDVVRGNDCSFHYYFNMKIYGRRFQTYIPFFTEFPTEDQLKRESGEIEIPCLSIVDDVSQYEDSFEDIETTIKTSIIQVA